jgi:RNA ligase (TIGR02306 family)
MRHLASIKKIAEIKSIPDADRICAYRVDGWWVVDQITKYNIGDLVIYVEIDSWVPNTLASFLSKDKEPKEYQSIKGERLKTVRLKKTLSQGLLLPVNKEHIVDTNNSNYGSFYTISNNIDNSIIVEEGQDVSEYLGIVKWEAPIPAELSGQVKGLFPNFIPKTDQVRIQSLTSEFNDWKIQKLTWESTEKLDGTSMTVFYKNGYFGLCGRNWELNETETNTLWKVAREAGLEEKLKNIGKNIAIQGELIGESIQSNRYKLKGQKFFVYDIYDIDTFKYVDADTRHHLVREIGIDHVPIIDNKFIIGKGITIQSILTSAEGKSTLNSKAEREGLVFKCIENPSISFKAISNMFLLKYNE